MKGATTYSTGFGAILTILIYSVVLVYGHLKYDKLINRQDTAHQVVTAQNVVDPTEIFKLKDINQNFAFGLWTNMFVPLNMNEISDFV